MPKIMPSVTPIFFFINISVAAERLEIPLTISNANPEKSKSLKSTSANGNFLKYGSMPAIPIVFPLGSTNIITLPNTAPTPINNVQKIRIFLATLNLDFSIFTILNL
ncbi:MAG: hypothetical protein SOT09_03125 [Candidatus Borkfalkiaceae bacterium]|nr:hypothetical protein [Christensenellaceae bacterium]